MIDHAYALIDAVTQQTYFKSSTVCINMVAMGYDFF